MMKTIMKKVCLLAVSLCGLVSSPLEIAQSNSAAALMKKLITSLNLTRLISLLALFYFTPAFTQSNQAGNNNAQRIVPVITLLLSDDGDECIELINVGDVVFDSLDPACPSERQNGAAAAQYFSFSHPGGPLHVDLLSDFPTVDDVGLDATLVLREGDVRDGMIRVFDDDGHDDATGSRIRMVDLPAGRYTLEVTAFVSGLSGNTSADTSRFNLSVYGDRVTATATGRLNDTGIVFAGNSNNSNSDICNAASGAFALQDCDFGRDNNLIIGRGFPGNDGDGEDGFSFLKVSSSGAPLPVSTATPHACVKDNVTGLMWEVKTDNTPADLHDVDHTYTWYNSNPNENGGAAGQLNGGSCFTNVNCDTQGYVTAVNLAGLCDYNDWRMPTVTELQGLLNYNNVLIENTLDSEFFPNANIGFFWSASPASNNTGSAWGVDFNTGIDFSGSRSVGRSVRLVRGGSAQ